MKKQLLFILLSLLPLVASAYDAEIDGIYYNFSEDEAEVTYKTYYDNMYFSDYPEAVVIPAYVHYNGKTYSVTSIGEHAFNSCRNMNSITIPSSVTNIRECAFQYCRNLSSIMIPSRLTTIGKSAFSGCTALTSFTIPGSVTSIGDDAFIGCSGLTSIIIPSSVTSIGDGVFAYCSNLTSVFVDEGNTFYKSEDGMLMNIDGTALLVYPAGKAETAYMISGNVKIIRGSAFEGCTSLTSITIPGSVMSVGANAFAGCNSLTSVHISDLESWCKIDFNYNSANPLLYAHHLFLNGEEIKDLVIPASVMNIGHWTFTSCTGLTSVTIPDGVTSVGNWAFSGCSGITSVTIPESMTSLGVHAFSGCSRLTSINLPNSILSIGGSALSGTALTSIEIPVGVSTIDQFVFYGCKGLTSVTIPDGVTSIGDGAFCGCNNLTSISVPNSVTSIGRDAFSDCLGLTSITIGNGVTFIGINAFSACNSLTDFYCMTETVPNTANNSFSFTPIASATLHVPAGSVDLYKETEPWSSFGSIVAIEPLNGSFLSEGMAWVDGFGYEQDGHYKTDDVKLFYYTTAGDTLIGEKSYFRIQRIKKSRTKTYEESKYEIFDDNLCFFMREDDAGDVWLYAKDKNVFYELSGNTLYDHIADDLVGRDLFLFNAKKKYAVGDKLPLGMSALVDPDGFQESEDYWHIYSLDVEDVSERNLLDGKIYPIYNNYFLESIGPLDGPLSGIGSPNSYSLDFRQLFAFYRDGQLIYKNEGYIAALEEYFPNILGIITGANPNGIENISGSTPSSDIYDLQGRKLAEPQKGINILRHSDGTTRKVLIK